MRMIGRYFQRPSFRAFPISLAYALSSQTSPTVHIQTSLDSLGVPTLNFRSDGHSRSKLD